MGGMTITEFILARVAEDEAKARNPDAAYQPHLGACSYDLIEFGNDECVCQLPARVLDECEAKRRIVELTVSWRDHADRFATGSDAVSAVLEAQALTAETVLGVLARVWVDHPDYREEWR